MFTTLVAIFATMLAGEPASSVVQAGPPTPAVRYEAVRSEDGYRLIAYAGSKSLVGPVGAYVEVKSVVDFDGDGVLDALISVSHGGNGNPDEFMFVSMVEGQLIEVAIAQAWGDYAVTELNGRKVVQRKSVDGTTFYSFDGHSASVAGKLPPLKAVAELHGLGALYTGPEKSKTLEVDIDGDGKPDHLTCRIWPRWGSLVGCTVVLGRRIQEVTPGGYGCDRIGVLNARRNGFRKIVCNNDTIFSFDGKSWELEGEPK